MNIETLESIGMHSGQVNTLHLVVPMGLKLGDDSCLAEKKRGRNRPRFA